MISMKDRLGFKNIDENELSEAPCSLETDFGLSKCFVVLLKKAGYGGLKIAIKPTISGPCFVQIFHTKR